jgi:hypothetical protein
MQTTNTVTRKIAPESPIYAPFVFNLFLLLIIGLLYLFNAGDKASFSVLSTIPSTFNSRNMTNDEKRKKLVN